jgi:hypothetical protein
MSEFIAGLPDEYTYEATGWIFLHRLKLLSLITNPGLLPPAHQDSPTQVLLSIKVSCIVIRET